MKIKISQPLCFSAFGQKPNQEDSLFPPKGEATHDSRVFLVCDGMGGHEHGEVASACVADTIGRHTAQLPASTAEEMKQAFEDALRQAYARLNELDHSQSEKKMGTTLTFLALCNDGALVAHIGDSRVYQFRPGRGVVFQTRDHSLVNDLIAAGELSEEEAKTFSQRNVITRAVQPHQEYPAKAAFTVLTDIRPGDLFFLCCDGVLEQLDNSDLERLLLSHAKPEERLRSLQEECEKRNTRDNNTAYLIEVKEVEDADQMKLSMVAPQENVKTEATTNEVTRSRVESRKSRSGIVIAVCLLVIAAILSFLFWGGRSEQKTEESSQPHKVEKVEKEGKTQGNIQRQKK